MPLYRSPRSRDGGVDHVPLPASPGRLWLCGKHHIGPDPESALAAVHATVAVCLTERHEIEERYPAYVAWLEAHAHGRALWFPVPDLHAPSLAGALRVVDAVRPRLDRGEVVLVHCGAGMGRAGTMATALLLSHGVGLREAVATVAERRPGAGPEVGAQEDLVAALADHFAAVNG